MTPEWHLTQAEKLLHEADSFTEAVSPSYARDLVQAALAHAVIALAGELGVPHGGTGGGAAGAQATSQAG